MILEIFIKVWPRDSAKDQVNVDTTQLHYYYVVISAKLTTQQSAFSFTTWPDVCMADNNITCTHQC